MPRVKAGIYQDMTYINVMMDYINGLSAVMDFYRVTQPVSSNSNIAKSWDERIDAILMAVH